MRTLLAQCPADDASGLLDKMLTGTVGGTTAIHEALSRGSDLAAAAQLEWASPTSSTHVAEVVALLLKHGGDPNAVRESDGATPLMEAMRMGLGDAFSIIVDQGGDAVGAVASVLIDALDSKADDDPMLTIAAPLTVAVLAPGPAYDFRACRAADGKSVYTLVGDAAPASGDDDAAWRRACVALACGYVHVSCPEVRRAVLELFRDPETLAYCRDDRSRFAHLVACAEAGTTAADAAMDAYYVDNDMGGTCGADIPSKLPSVPPRLDGPGLLPSLAGISDCGVAAMAVWLLGREGASDHVGAVVLYPTSNPPSLPAPSRRASPPHPFQELWRRAAFS